MPGRVTCIHCRFSHLKTDCVTGAPILECRHRSPAFEGSFAKRWARVGNSVAPPVSKAIGIALRKALDV